MDGIVYALDLGVRSGWCYGPPGAEPVSGTVLLKRDGEDKSVAFGNLIWFLNREWTRARPAMRKRASSSARAAADANQPSRR